MAVARVYWVNSWSTKQTFFDIEQFLWYMNFLFFGPIMAAQETNRLFKYAGLACLPAALLIGLAELVLGAG